MQIEYIEYKLAVRDSGRTTTAHRFLLAEPETGVPLDPKMKFLDYLDNIDHHLPIYAVAGALDARSIGRLQLNLIL